MFNSKEYWEKRYLSKNNSGAGSYGHLAEFKSEIINEFLDKHNIVHFEDGISSWKGDVEITK